MNVLSINFLKMISVNKRPILLTSLPRSGSTWVLKILGYAKEVIPFHEPDHLDFVGIGTNGMHPYIKQRQYSEEYFNLYYNIFKGNPYKPFSPKKEYLLYKINVIEAFLTDKRILVKSVYSLLNTEWIFEHFNPIVVVLLRNPFSTIHSIHRKFPDARLRNLLIQDNLMQDYLSSYKEILQSAKTPYEILAANLGAYFKVALSAAKRNPEWIVVTHEQLCVDPYSEFNKLYKKLGLTWSDKIEHLIRMTNQPKQNDNMMHVWRVLKDEVVKWKKLLTPEEVSQIRNYYRPFENTYYDEL